MPDLLDMPAGTFPEIIPLTSPQDEIARIANEVAAFVKHGMSKRDLLLLHSDGEVVKKSDPCHRGPIGKRFSQGSEE